MQDELDRVPADTIFYSEAFERVFDVLQPRAPKMRAVICRLSVMSEASFKNPSDALKKRRYGAFKKWNEIRSKAQNFFRNQLAMGRLNFYQRDPVTGEKLRLHPDLFLSKYAFNRFSPDPLDPPIFFIKADFETWLENCSKGLASELSPVLGRTKAQGSEAAAVRLVTIGSISRHLCPIKCMKMVISIRACAVGKLWPICSN